MEALSWFQRIGPQSNLMPTPGKHKTGQTRILKYAQDVGWTFVSRQEAEERRAGVQPANPGETRAEMPARRCPSIHPKISRKGLLVR